MVHSILADYRGKPAESGLTPRVPFVIVSRNRLKSGAESVCNLFAARGTIDRTAVLRDDVGRNSESRVWHRDRETGNRRTGVQVGRAGLAGLRTHREEAYRLVLFLGILGMLQLRQLRSPYPPSRREIASSPGPAPAQQSRPQYYEEAVYVTGLGYVNSESGYRFFEENAHEVGQIRSNSLPLDSWRPGTGVARAAGPVPCGGPAGGPEILGSEDSVVLDAAGSDAG